MIHWEKKHIRIATWRERIDDVLALYNIKQKVRKEAEETGVVTKNTTFPLSIGFSYITKGKNTWILNMKYRNYDEWKADCDEYTWEFQICHDRENGDFYAVRTFKLPSGREVCCIFPPFNYEEYSEFHPVKEGDICSVMNRLLDMFDMESIIEYEDKLYITSKNMFVVGTSLAFNEHIYLFDKQLYYKRMSVDIDIPTVVCAEMLYRSNKLSMEWEGGSDTKFIPRAFFKKHT